MPKDIQQPFVGRKLQQQYELRGSVRPVLDDVVVPVAIVDDLSDAVPLVSPRVRRAQWAVAGDNVIGNPRSIIGCNVRTPPGVFCRIDRVFLQLATEGANITFRGGIGAHYHDTSQTFDVQQLSAGEKRYQDGRLNVPGEEEFPFTEITAGFNSSALGLGGMSDFYATPSGPQNAGILTPDRIISNVDWRPPGGMYLGRNEREDTLYFQVSPDHDPGAGGGAYINVHGLTWALDFSEWFKV